jgi:hypothetical protein
LFGQAKAINFSRTPHVEKFGVSCFFPTDHKTAYITQAFCRGTNILKTLTRRRSKKQFVRQFAFFLPSLIEMAVNRSFERFCQDKALQKLTHSIQSAQSAYYIPLLCDLPTTILSICTVELNPEQKLLHNDLCFERFL